MVSPDGTFEGRAAIREYWSQNRASFPDCTLTLDASFERGGTVAEEFTWAGTNTGPIVMPDGTELAPAGRRVESKGMEVEQVRDRKIAVQHLYWDNMAFAAQLGLAPEGPLI